MQIIENYSKIVGFCVKLYQFTRQKQQKVLVYIEIYPKAGAKSVFLQKAGVLQSIWG